jgi:hypothetical protein
MENNPGGNAARQVRDAGLPEGRCNLVSGNNIQTLDWVLEAVKDGRIKGLSDDYRREVAETAQRELNMKLMSNYRQGIADAADRLDDEYATQLAAGYDTAQASELAVNDLTQWARKMLDACRKVIDGYRQDD